MLDYLPMRSAQSLPSFQSVFGSYCLTASTPKYSAHHHYSHRTANQLSPSKMLTPHHQPAQQRRKRPQSQLKTGRWTPDEQEKFVQGLREYGKDWKKIGSLIPTRTLVQIRTHAQKMFQKLNIKSAADLNEATLDRLLRPASP